jgi:tetratricopeptide (TPR) repeat protein
LLAQLKKYSAAEPHLKRGVKILEKRLGRTHPNLAPAITALGWVYLHTNRLSEAEQLHLRLIDIRTKDSNVPLNVILQDYMNLASIYIDQDALEKSEKFLETAKGLYFKSHDWDDIKITSKAYSLIRTLINVYEKQGKLSQAAKQFEKLVQVRYARYKQQIDDLPIMIDAGGLLFIAEDLRNLCKRCPDPTCSRAL